MRLQGSRVERVRRRLRAISRDMAVRFGGLPHTEGTVDSPPPEIAHDITGLWLRNLRSRARVTDHRGSEVVNLTTHGDRLRDVWVAIESVARGSVLPARIILWLDTEPGRLPRSLRRLQKRGLEVAYTAAGNGVHTKYWPYVSTQSLDRPLVLCDDDIIYPSTWLEGLRRAWETSDDSSTIAYRAHAIAMTDEYHFTPYTTWAPCRTDSPSYTTFATTVSGQLLSSELQGALRDAGTAFLHLSPTNDDIWIHRCAVQAGIRTRQVSEHQQHWYFIPGSQTSGLNAVNVAGGANDVQFADAHNARTRSRIWKAIQESPPASAT
jgi:hypothetical protein